MLVGDIFQEPVNLFLFDHSSGKYQLLGLRGTGEGTTRLQSSKLQRDVVNRDGSNEISRMKYDFQKLSVTAGRFEQLAIDICGVNQRPPAAVAETKSRNLLRKSMKLNKAAANRCQ